MQDKKKFILSDIEITEISAVDDPAQEFAKVCMIKRVENEKDKKMPDDLIEGKKVKCDECGKDVDCGFPEKKKYGDGDMKKSMMTEQHPKEYIDDPIVYTTNCGQELKKSMGDAMIVMAKKLDETRKKLDESEEIRCQEKLEERADTEFGNLLGTTAQRSELLKVIDSLPDETKKWAMKELKVKNDSLSKAFESIGTSQGSEVGTSEDQIERLTQSLMNKDAKITYEQAYCKVLQSESGRALYNSK